MAYWNVGANAAFLGEFATALAALEHTTALGTARDDRRLQHMAAIYQAWVQVMQGQSAMGIATYQHLLAHDPDPSMAFTVRLYLGLAYVEQGGTTQAIPLLEQVMQRAQDIRFPFAESRTAALLAEAWLLAGHLEQAQHMAQPALQLSQNIACTYITAYAQRVLGRLAQVTGAITIAAEHFRQAFASLRRYRPGTKSLAPNSCSPSWRRGRTSRRAAPCLCKTGSAGYDRRLCRLTCIALPYRLTRRQRSTGREGQRQAGLEPEHTSDRSP